MSDSIKPMAFYCCGIRAQDAQNSRSVVGDIYADGFMTPEGWSIFNRFNGRGDAATKETNLVRGRIIQDKIARHLKDNPRLQIINVGAGFDSRPYRMAGGVWAEIDEHDLVDHKNSHLSVHDCPNPLSRIGIDFAKDGALGAALGTARDHFVATNPDGHTLVVIEGVLMYLNSTQVKELLGEVLQTFPRHTLICELLSKPFIDRFMHKNTREQLAALDSSFKLFEEHPEQLFLDGGYRPAGKPVSVAARTRELKMGPPLPGFLLDTVLTTVRDGYQVHTFKAG